MGSAQSYIVQMSLQKMQFRFLLLIPSSKHAEMSYAVIRLL